ncbi:MBL fold metallo-hydrolase [Nocardioides plantarum]|uniref:MBL fold metallo-hydrolase n=1 Tax=Nocardioides plantarum TaxID=29299 RepID=A0ABV5KEV4_9ACTN|nr:MBL fold metallo-hydrolase [Nocardioides plantarum]
MRIDVINVGDGACTAVESYVPDRGELTIIDCGTHPHSKVVTTPGVAAAAHLGGRLTDLDTIVVTHFDTDHWHGLLELADFYGARETARKAITLRYPGMPDLGERVSARQARAGLMALISTRDDDPLNLVRLKTAWEQVGSVSAVPLYRGDVFDANGRQWRVHWPPRQVDVTRGKKYAAAIREVLDLADDMAADGYTKLRDQFEEAYGAWEEFEDQPDAIEAVPHDADPRSEEEPVDPEDEADLDQDDDEDVDLDHVPEKHRAEFRRLVAKLDGLDNYFSLVLSVDDQFIVFGDIEGTALRAVVTETRPEFALAGHYGVMLAPHHGSHVAHASRLPAADLCICQSGSKHQGKNRLHELRHSSACHPSTWECGTICVTTW